MRRINRPFFMLLLLVVCGVAQQPESAGPVPVPGGERPREWIAAANQAMQRRVDALPGSLAERQRQFQNPPDDARIMMRWWWFGPAVTKAGIERELRAMKEAGIGGVEIQPVYPLALDDESQGIKNLRSLSPEFLEVLQFANRKARELGLRIDLTLGSGWPYGGPHVPISQAASRLRVERIQLQPHQKTVPLPKLNEWEKLLACHLVSSDGRAIQELTAIQNGPVEIIPARRLMKRRSIFPPCGCSRE